VRLKPSDGTVDNTVMVLESSFYPLLTHAEGTSQGNEVRNIYDFDNVVRYTNEYSREDFLKDIIIPVHLPHHWIIVLLIPSEKKIILIDSMRKKRDEVIKNIKLWYTEHMQLFNCDLSESSDHNISNWKLIEEHPEVPIQNDGSSCGVFVCMTAYHWLIYHTLPSTNDWECSDVDCDLRNFILNFLLTAIDTESNRTITVD
jgi:Ulp1 family protease